MIIWRKTATLQLLNILKWFRNEGYFQAADNLIIKVDEVTTKVYEHPTIGKPSLVQKGVRSYRVDGFRRLFYRKKGKKLFVLSIFDQRQDPSKNPY